MLDELIAFGWIDQVRRKIDDARTMQLVSPRKQQAWAKTYKNRAARLSVEERMHPAGRAAIHEAEQVGRWDETAALDALEVPDDLTVALHDRPTAAGFFAAEIPSYRRSFLR